MVRNARRRCVAVCRRIGRKSSCGNGECVRRHRASWRRRLRLGWRLGRIGPRSEEHTSELQSLMRISYAVFCLKKKKTRPLLDVKPQNCTENVTHTDTNIT